MLPTLSTSATAITTIAGPAAASVTMTSRSIARLGRLAQQQPQWRALRTLTCTPSAARPRAAAFSALAFRRPATTALFRPVAVGQTSSPRFLASTSCLGKIDPAKAIPTGITENQYHELADEYLEAILSKFEELQDEGEDLDVEFSAGVMNLKFPFGTYVLNKQPPNKQIWLASPKTGPKRYDWVVVNEGQDSKEGTGVGEWVYTRDGTTINDLFEAETGIDLAMPIPHYGE